LFTTESQDSKQLAWLCTQAMRIKQNGRHEPVQKVEIEIIAQTLYHPANEMHFGRKNGLGKII